MVQILSFLEFLRERTVRSGKAIIQVVQLRGLELGCEALWGLHQCLSHKVSVCVLSESSRELLENTNV